MSLEMEQRILELCLRQDVCALHTYRVFSQAATQVELRTFWQQMADDEAQHVAFWQSVQQRSADTPLPQVFNDPATVLSELEQIDRQVQVLAAHPDEIHDTTAAFLLAYRLELHALHPAFGVLFQVLRHLTDLPSPADAYDRHLARFTDMLIQAGAQAPALTLLGETLNRLWTENRALTVRATHDGLTNLLNRQAFWEMATHLARLAVRQQLPVAVLMADIDHFKRINDTVGHAAGDRVLRKVADAIAAAVRTSDLVARYGGEEFVVFMYATDVAQAVDVAERVLDAVAHGTATEQPVTVSIGLDGSLVAHAEQDLQRLLANADSRLYAAKAAGRNRVVFAPPDEADPGTPAR